MVPQDPNGVPDAKKGITQFIVGTGGESLDTLARNSDGSFTNRTLSPGRTRHTAR